MGKYLLFLASINMGAQLLGGGSANTTASIATAPTEGAQVQTIEAVLPKNEVQEIQTLWVTAYSSTPEETDDTAFITASGRPVRDGIVATNHLPFGTKVKIPALFGDKIFTVEDRMHRSKEGFMDVWMPSKQTALRFGITHTEVLVLKDAESPKHPLEVIARNN